MKRDQFKKFQKMLRIVFVALCLLLLVEGALAKKREFSGWAFIGHDIPIGSDHGVPKTPWYEVSQWEVKVCSYLGGNDPSAATGSDVRGDYYHNLMVTLQAQVSNPLPSAPSSSASSKTRIYEVAYFVQPTQDDETVNFEVWIKSNKGEERSIASGSSNYVNGIRDYWVEESEMNYTKAWLRYWNAKRAEQKLEIAFQEQQS